MGASIYTNNQLSPLISFFESQPSLSVSFVKFLMSNDIMSALKIGSIDVALERVPDGFNDRSELYFIQDLFYEPRCIFMSKDDPRASREYLTIDELADSPIISGSKDSPTDQRIRNFFAPLGNSLRISYRCDENASMANLVQAGKGISLGPKSFGRYFGIAAVPVYPVHEEPIQFVCLKESLNRPEIKALLEYLTSSCRDMNL